MAEGLLPAWAVGVAVAAAFVVAVGLVIWDRRKKDGNDNDSG